MTRLRPLGDRIVIEEQESAKTTASGIVLPPTMEHDAKPGIGTIVALGPGPRSPFTGETARMDLKAGMTVVYAPMAGLELEIDQKTMVTLRESDVIAVIEDE